MIGRKRPEISCARLYSMPLFQLNTPLSSSPESQLYEPNALNWCLMLPGCGPHALGARGSSAIQSPWKSALLSEFVLPLASLNVYDSMPCQWLPLNFCRVTS